MGQIIYLRVGISNISHLENTTSRIFTLENLFKHAEAVSETVTLLDFELADAADYEIFLVRKEVRIVLQRPEEDWGKDGKVDKIDFSEMTDKISRLAFLNAYYDLSYVVPSFTPK